MAVQYDTGQGGWIDPATGRKYSWQEAQAAQQQAQQMMQGFGNPFDMGRSILPPGPTTTAPQLGAAGSIADPRTQQQIASMNAGPSQRAAPSVYEPYYHNAQAGGSIADGGPGAAYGNQAGAPAAGITAQDRVNARAQARADSRLQNELKTPTGLADLFGVGGGDWASQWGKQANPQSSQYAGYSPAGGLNDLMGAFNSASGPYGQLQSAAAYTAPARNDRQARMYEADTTKDIAKMKYSTANRVLSNLANLMQGGQQMNGFETDYGASAMLKPTNLKRFF